MVVEALEKPLPKPTGEDYISTRLLEALAKAYLALEFLGKGFVRNAAGKAFQAWRALLAALLRLELDRLVRIAKSDEERRWLRERAAPGVPTSRTKTLSQMLEEAGRPGVSLGTALALELHGYQYNGSDPDMAVSKYRNREEATVDVRLLVKGLAKRVEELKPRVKWYDELENTLKKAVEALGGKQ